MTFSPIELLSVRLLAVFTIAVLLAHAVGFYLQLATP